MKDLPPGCMHILKLIKGSIPRTYYQGILCADFMFKLESNYSDYLNLIIF